MNGAQVRIVEEIDKERFSGLLQCLNSLTLPSGRTLIGGHHLRNFADLSRLALVTNHMFCETYESLEGSPKEKKIC